MLVTCSSCNGQISNEASTCPHCGHYYSYTASNAHGRRLTDSEFEFETNYPNGYRSSNSGCLGPIIIVVLYLLYRAAVEGHI